MTEDLLQKRLLKLWDCGYNAAVEGDLTKQVGIADTLIEVVHFAMANKKKEINRVLYSVRDNK